MLDAINYVYFIIIIIFGFPTTATTPPRLHSHKQKSKINSLCAVKNDNLEEKEQQQQQR